VNTADSYHRSVAARAGSGTKKFHLLWCEINASDAPWINYIATHPLSLKALDQLRANLGAAGRRGGGRALATQHTG